MRILIILLFSLSLYAENIICLNAIDDMILAIENNDKTKALQLTDIIVKECEDIEAVVQAGAVRQPHAVGAQCHLDIKCHAIAVVDRIGIALPGRLVAALPRI